MFSLQPPRHIPTLPIRDRVEPAADKAMPVIPLKAEVNSEH